MVSREIPPTSEWAFALRDYRFNPAIEGIVHGYDFVAKTYCIKIDDVEARTVFIPAHRKPARDRLIKMGGWQDHTEKVRKVALENEAKAKEATEAEERRIEAEAEARARSKAPPPPIPVPVPTPPPPPLPVGSEAGPPAPELEPSKTSGKSKGQGKGEATPEAAKGSGKAKGQAAAEPAPVAPTVVRRRGADVAVSLEGKKG